MISNISGMRIIGWKLEIIHNIDFVWDRRYVEFGFPITNYKFPAPSVQVFLAKVLSCAFREWRSSQEVGDELDHVL